MITLTKLNYIKGDKITVSIRLPKELKKALQECAKSRGYKFSSFVQEGLDQWVSEHLETKKK